MRAGEFRKAVLSRLNGIDGELHAIEGRARHIDRQLTRIANALESVSVNTEDLSLLRRIPREIKPEFDFSWLDAENERLQKLIDRAVEVEIWG